MTDQFTQAVAREVATLLAQQGQQFQSTATTSDSEGLGFQLSPQQVLEVMQGNSQWLSQFEGDLENSFRRVADRALDYWLKHTDREIRDSLRALADIARLLIEQTQDSQTTLTPGASSESLVGNTANLAGNLGGRAIDTLFSALFTRDRRYERETDRSQQENSGYRASRGQLQARLSKELARGKRYT